MTLSCSYARLLLDATSNIGQFEMAKYSYSKILGDYYPSASHSKLICLDNSKCSCKPDTSGYVCPPCGNIKANLDLSDILDKFKIDIVEHFPNRLTCKCQKCSHIWNTSKASLRKSTRGCPKCVSLYVGSRNAKFYTLEELQEHLPKTIKLLDWIDNHNVRVSCLICKNEWDKHYLWVLRSQKACPTCHYESQRKWTKETAEALFNSDGRSHLKVLFWPNSTDNKAKLHCTQCDNVWEAKAENYTLKKSACPKCSICNSSRVQIVAMELVGSRLDIDFDRHSGNSEYTILKPESSRRFRADGYSTATDTVFEFHGDAFHGNLNRYAPDATPNYFAKHLTTQELYDRTILREDYIKSLGYRLIVWWELDYRNDRDYIDYSQITIGNAFVAVRDGMNLEQLKANLIAEDRKAELPLDAGLQEVLWKYPSLKRETGFAEVSKEVYQVRILEATQHYVIFECEDDRYITRSLT